MNERIGELSKQVDAVVLGTMTGKKQYTFLEHDLEKFYEIIVQQCADYVRENYDHEHAESIAWTMEIDFGLHGDYA